MAVICELDCGWVVDHKQAIDRVYYETYTLPEHTEDTLLVQKHFQCLSDLFDIRQPFMMDSQFEKLKKSANSVSQTDGPETVTGSTRRKTRVGLFGFFCKVNIKYHVLPWNIYLTIMVDFATVGM